MHQGWTIPSLDLVAVLAPAGQSPKQIKPLVLLLNTPVSSIG